MLLWIKMESKLIIKRADNSYLPDITQLFYNTIQSVCKKDYTREEVDDWSSRYLDTEKWMQRIDEQYFIVAILNGKTVGFASLATDGYLDFLFVHKDYERQGIAFRLLKELEIRALEQENLIIYSDVSITARPFFERYGYKVEKQQLKKCRDKELINFRMSKKIPSLNIREIQKKEIPILHDLLYEAIFQPEGTEHLPKSIIEDPSLKIFIDNFGEKKDDHCFLAEYNGKIAGGVWVRILNGEVRGFGNIDNKTPEFAISLFREFRNKGIGTLMMKKMIEHLKEKGYEQASLSVDKANYAAEIYKKLGFEIIKENREDYLMLIKFS